MVVSEQHGTDGGIWTRVVTATAGAALAALICAPQASAMGLAGGTHSLPCPAPVVAGSLALGMTQFRPDPAGEFHPVSFDPQTFALRPESRTTLDELGNALHSEQLGGFRFAAVAHVEPLGDPSREKKATVLMATAVAAYLVELRGVDPDQLVWSACGAMRNAGEPAGDPTDRGIVIINLGAR